MKSKSILRQNIKKSVQRSVSWTILTTLLGLIQLWITICVSYVLTHISYSMWGALQEGALLFFIMAVTTAITTDYHFTAELRISQSIRGIIFTLFPFLIGVFVTALYVALYISDSSKVDRPALVLIQGGIITLTIIYALIAKAIMFFSRGDVHMIEAVIIFFVVSVSIFLIAAYYGFKEIIEQNYDLSDDGSSKQDAVQPDSTEQLPQS